MKIEKIWKDKQNQNLTYFELGQKEEAARIESILDSLYPGDDVISGSCGGCLAILINI